MIFATGKDAEKAKSLFVTKEDEDSAITLSFGRIFSFFRALFK